MNLALASCHPHGDSSRWKQDPDGLDSDMSEDNLGGEAKEALVQITGFPSKWDATEKCEPKTVKAAQHLSSDLQVLE